MESALVLGLCKHGSFFHFFAVNVVDGEMLTITKVSRLHMAAYLCVASNGVPPSISKRVLLRVQCKIYPIAYYLSLNSTSCILKSNFNFTFRILHIDTYIYDIWIAYYVRLNHVIFLLFFFSAHETLAIFLFFFLGWIFKHAQYKLHYTFTHTQILNNNASYVFNGIWISHTHTRSR